MQSSSSQQTFRDKSQDITSVRSEGNNLPVDLEVHHHPHHDRELGSLSFQANSTPGAPTEEAIAVDSINRLPVELLSEIFLVCAHTLNQSELASMKHWGDIPPHHCRPIFAPNAVPYTISSVCKRWRLIGLSTPKLWSKFTIPADPYSDCELENFIVALRTWLKRSKNQPLQFTCVSGEDVIEEVVIELAKNMHRWHTAYFSNWDDWGSDFAWDWSRNDEFKAENLVTLEFDSCYPSLNIAFQQFPNLCRLRIHPDCLAVEEARGLSLTHLALNDLEGNTATFFSYLRLFPSLISFEAPVNWLDHDLNHTLLTTCTHTTLTELTIAQCKHNRTLMDILNNIQLPSIRRLCLNYEYEGHLFQRFEMADVVHDFIRRHESTFTDLELSGLETSSEEMIEIIHMFPKYLTSCQSFLDDLTDECVKRLTLDPSNPSHDLAPNISSISLHVPSSSARGPSGDLLAEMILSRWARNPHTTFELWTNRIGLNPLLDPRIARRVQNSPGLLLSYW